jgi:YVTN family beta-propeller protein
LQQLKSVIKSLIHISLFSVIIFLLSGCENSQSPQLGEPVKFSRDILPIFEQNCNFPGCHNSADKQAGIDLTSWDALMKRGSNYGAEIVPFNSYWSHLVQHINRIDTNISAFSEPLMPKTLRPYTEGQPLLSNQLLKITEWINQGAKNDYGEVAFSNITNKAFITNQASDLIAVVNLDNNFLIRLIETGGRNNTNQPLDAPHVIIVDKQARYFYVSLIAEGYIEKFDVMTYQKVGRMQAGTSPAHIVISADGSYGYFSNFDVTPNPEKCVKRFDTQTMTITNVITDDSRPFGMWQPHGLRLTNDGKLLLCATERGEFLYVINTADNQIIDAVRVDPSVPLNGSGTGNFIPYQVAVTPDDKFAYVSCLKSNDVRVFDITSRTFIQNIAVGLNPLALEISPDGRWCYVPNRNSNSVSVIDLQTNSVVKTISNIGAQPHKIDFTANSRFAYVTCESVSGTFVHHPTTSGKRPGTTAVIDVLNGHIKIKDIEMASFPAGISITPK